MLLLDSSVHLTRKYFERAFAKHFAKCVSGDNNQLNQIDKSSYLLVILLKADSYSNCCGYCQKQKEKLHSNKWFVQSYLEDIRA
jgi:hypothetical protein